MRRLLSELFGFILCILLLPASVPSAESPSTQPRLSAASDTHLFGTPDESAEPIASVKKGEKLSPMAETVGAGDVRWYLVRTESGVAGWIKAGDSKESKKLESFFESIPYEVGRSRSVALPKPPSGSLPSGTIVVPVQMIGASAVVPVTLNGAVKTNLVLDTGADVTMVSNRIARRLSLRTVNRGLLTGIGGAVKLKIARLRSLKAGEAEIQNLLVAVHDFRTHPGVEGLLGMNFLRRYHVSLDSRKKILVLSPR